LSLEWKRVEVTESDSGDDETDELRELGWEEWEKELSGLGWRNEAGSLFNSKGKEMHNEMSGQWFFKEEDDGRERVTEDEKNEFQYKANNRDQILEIARLSSSKNFII